MIATLEDLYDFKPKIFTFIEKNISPIEKQKISPYNEEISNEFPNEKEKKLKFASDLLQYFRKYTYEERVPTPPSELVQDSTSQAQKIMQDIFPFPGPEIQHPRINGELDWHYLGPEKDVEYGYRVNRFAWVPALIQEYERTQNEDYVKYTNQALQTWILSNPMPRIKQDNERWRVMEAGLRQLIPLPLIFFKLQHSPHLSKATQILLIFTLIQNAEYVHLWHAFQGNHLLIEMNGLLMTAATFPELKQSKKWIRFAKKKILKELLKRQVYPDGLQKELSAQIHYLTLTHFEDVGKLALHANSPFPIEYYNMIKKMYEYLGKCVKPDGNLPFNNDCPFFLRNWKPILQQKEKELGISNLTQYCHTSSTFFEYGGQLIMCNSWEKRTHWAFFDIGPSGFSPSHLHRDKLHFSLYVDNRDILIDPGFYHHQREKWRNLYFNGTAAHNTIMIDGLQQRMDRFQAHKPNSNFFSHQEFDFGFGSYNQGYGIPKLGVRMKVSKKIKDIFHSRSIFYRRNHYWLVIDYIDTTNPHLIETLWHFHPSCHPILESNGVFTNELNYGNVSLQLVYSSTNNTRFQIVQGQMDPIQGWYAPEYKKLEKSPCLIGKTNINHPTIMIWKIEPFLTGIKVEDQNSIQAEEMGNLLKISMTNIQNKQESSLEINTLIFQKIKAIPKIWGTFKEDQIKVLIRGK